MTDTVIALVVFGVVIVTFLVCVTVVAVKTDRRGRDEES